MNEIELVRYATVVNKYLVKYKDEWQNVLRNNTLYKKP